MKDLIILAPIRVLEKGCARLTPCSPLRLIGGPSCSFMHARCWSSSAPHPNPHLTGESVTPTLDWDGMRENVIVSRSHLLGEGATTLLHEPSSKGESNLNKCLVQGLFLAPLQETQVRASGNEQNGRAEKSFFIFPFGSVCKKARSRRKKQLPFRRGGFLPIDSGRPYKG